MQDLLQCPAVNLGDISLKIKPPSCLLNLQRKLETSESNLFPRVVTTSTSRCPRCLLIHYYAGSSVCAPQAVHHCDIVIPDHGGNKISRGAIITKYGRLSTTQVAEQSHSNLANKLWRTIITKLHTKCTCPTLLKAVSCK